MQIFKVIGDFIKLVLLFFNIKMINDNKKAEDRESLQKELKDALKIKDKSDRASRINSIIDRL